MSAHRRELPASTKATWSDCSTNRRAPFPLRQSNTSVLQRPTVEQTHLQSPALGYSPTFPIETARKVALLGSMHGTEAVATTLLEDLTPKAQNIYRIGVEIPNVGILQSAEKDRALFKSSPSKEWLPLTALSPQTSKTGTILSSSTGPGSGYPDTAGSWAEEHFTSTALVPSEDIKSSRT